MVERSSPFVTVAALWLLMAGASGATVPLPAMHPGVVQPDAAAGGSAEGRALVSYAAPPTADERDALEAMGIHVLYRVRVVPVLVVEAPDALRPLLAGAPGVLRIDPDLPLWPALDTSRALVHANTVPRDHGVTGSGVTIAVMDTGVDPLHPDLAPKTLAGVDASIPIRLPGSVAGQGTPAPASDTQGHGTHVAGIAVGSGGYARGRYVGVAPGAGLVNVKVFDLAGNASTSYLLVGIDWVLDNKDELGIRVLQISLGGPPTDGTDPLSRAIDVASTRGLLTVAAAGNDGPGARTVGVPGVARSAITVGSVDDGLRIARSSARGPTPDDRQKPDLVAPGVGIMSTAPFLSNPEGYALLTGTSMAAPHVAGAAALMWDANATLTPAQVKAILIATARAVAPAQSGWSPDYGWGFLDVATAVHAARDPGIIAGLDRSLRALPQEEPNILDQLAFEAAKARRSVPGAADAFAVFAVVAVAIAWRPPRMRGEAPPCSGPRNRNRFI